MRLPPICTTFVKTILITAFMHRYFCTILTLLALTVCANATSVINTPGNLSIAVGNDTDISSLKITGEIDASDIEFIASALKNLHSLDLSETTIVEYHGQPIITGRTDFNANTLPDYSLAGTPIKELILPDELTAIGEGALLCTAIKNISFPSSLTSIGSSAMANCDSLSAVTIPSSVMFISDYTFMGCDNLQSVDMGNSVSSIGKAAFKNCVNLSQLTLPSTLNRIDDESFAGCSSLTTVSFPESLSSIGDYAFSQSGITNIDLTNTAIRKIGNWAFARCRQLTSIAIDDNMANMGQGVFFDCDRLTTANTPLSCTFINRYTHKGNTSLNSDNILHNGIIAIGDYAFMGMNHVETFSIPTSVDSVGNNAFEDWTSLSTLYLIDHTIVPDLGDSVWQDVNQSQATLYVNGDVFNDFASADQWKEFRITKYVGIDDIEQQSNGDAVKAHFSGSDLIISATTGISLISVYDPSGLLHISLQPDSESASIDTSSWNSNIYIIKVVLNNAHTTILKLIRH